MSLSSPLNSNILQDELLNDCNTVLRKLDKMKSVARSQFFMDSRLMMLKLRKARLGAQLAYSEHQALLAEIELRLADTDLRHELTRRRQFLTRSRAIRQIMKPPINVMSKNIETTEIHDDIDNAIKVDKNTVDKGIQVDKVIGDEIGTDKIERRINCVSSKNKQRPEKDSLSKDRTKTSSVGTKGTQDVSGGTTASRKERKNSNSSKKQKTNAERHSVDKSEKADRDKRDCKDKHRVKGDSKKSDKEKSCGTEKNKKSASNTQKLNNKYKRKDSESNEKHARKRNGDDTKKCTKSITKNHTTKEIFRSVNFISRNEDSKGNTSEEYSEPNLSSDVERTPLTEEINNICEASKDIKESATVNKAQPSNSNKCDIVSNNFNFGKMPDMRELTVVLEVTERNVMRQIKMCESKMEALDEELTVVKRERSSSISSVETLLIREESN